MTPIRSPLVAALLVAAWVNSANANDGPESLPVGSHPEALATPHFPDRLHAFVWRNWDLVPPAKLAETLGATTEQVEAVARSLGLPAARPVPEAVRPLIYITVLRRNWHLLPYDQLLTLLEMTPQRLAFALREDDFLYYKLGALKPRCDTLRYAEPTAEAQQRAAEIREVVARHFGKALDEPPAESPLSFRLRWEKASPEPRPVDRPADGAGPRFVSSYFGAYGDPLVGSGPDPFPDGLLAELAGQGVNGVWLHVVLRQLAPGGPDFPEFGEGHAQRLEALRKLVARAGRHGIGVYLYLNEPRSQPLAFFAGRPEMRGTVEGDHAAMCTADERVRRWLTSAVAYVAREVPGLGGVLTITASENLTNCDAHLNKAGCPRCSKRPVGDLITEVNTAIAEGLRQGSPSSRFLAWDWGWPEDAATAAAIIARLPAGSYFQTVSEWGLPIERGGIKTEVGEYALSAVGPSRRALGRWEVARSHQLKRLAKVQLGTTWELASVPSLPVLDLVAEHCANLARAGVDGQMLGWSLGGYPSANLRVAQEFARRPDATADAVLDAIATERYGDAAAPEARRAWRAFSAAFREFPFNVSVLYNAPQQMGPANLLYGRPTGYQASMVGFPYDNLDGWRGPYPPEVFAAQFRKVADGWSAGLAPLQAAVSQAPAGPKRLAAESDLGVAKAAGLHFASVANQARFVLARSSLTRTGATAAEVETARTELRSLLDDEIALARDLFPLARRDSRLGFEASNQYFYVPLDLVEKVLNCEDLKGRLASGTGF